MRVAIEIYDAGMVRGGTHYLRHLCDELSRLDPDGDYLLFGFQFRDPRRLRDQYPLPPGGRFRYCVRRWPESVVNRLQWGWGLPLVQAYLAARGVDVFHSFRLGGRRTALLLPDIVPLVRPHWVPPEGWWVWERRTLPAIRAARLILTFCEATKRDLIRELGVPADRIRITPLGVDRSLFFPVRDRAALEAARARLKLPPRFILTVGPFDHLCHFKGIAQAMARWKRSGEPPRLVAVGPVDDFTRGLQALAAAEGVAELVTWTGFLPHRDLAWAYNLADAVVHPSLLPGAELPPLEAMACGAPVVSSLDECIGDAGLLVDASSAEQIHEALRRLWESPSLREDLGRRGLSRAAEFTWERTARQTLQAYREIAGGPFTGPGR